MKMCGASLRDKENEMTDRRKITGPFAGVLVALLCIVLWPAQAFALQTGSNAATSAQEGWKTGTYTHILMTDTYDGSVIGEDTIQLKYTGSSTSGMRTLIYGTSGADRTLPASDTVAHVSGYGILPVGTNTGKLYTGTNIKTAMTHLPSSFQVDMLLNPLYYGRNLTISIPAGYRPASKSGTHTVADNPVWNTGTLNLYFPDADPGYSASAQGIAASFVENASMAGMMQANLGNGNYIRLNDSVLRLNVDPNRTTVSFDGNGGTLAAGSEDRTIVYGHTESIDLPGDPLREGFVFRGWNTKRDGTGETIDADTSLKTRFPAESAVTLYAQWAECGFYLVEGDTEFRAVHRVILTPENGEAEIRASLQNGQYVLIDGLEEGVRYQIAEDGRKLYKPEYEVAEGNQDVQAAADTADRGKGLGTPEEVLTSARAYEFVNTRDVVSEGMTLRVNKVLAGSSITDSDRQSPFTFCYYVQGLDPDLTYPVSVGESVTEQRPNAGGTLSGTVTIRAGESFSIAGLPEGAKYCVQEITEGLDPAYAVKYRVVNGAETVETVTDSGTYELHGSLSAGQMGLETNRGSEDANGGIPLETIREGVDVEYDFVNTKEEKHDLHLRKVLLDGETPVQSDEEFAFDVEFHGLTAGKTYVYTSEREGSQSFTGDGRGSAKVTVRVTSAQDEVHFPDLDGSCTYKVTEQANPCSAEAVITDEHGTVLATSSEQSGRSVSISNEQELETEEEEAGEDDEDDPDEDPDDDDETVEAGTVGFEGDQVVTITNTREETHDLFITKKVTGQDLTTEQKESAFTIRAVFTGLGAGETYTVEKTGKGLRAGSEESGTDDSGDADEEEDDEDEEDEEGDDVQGEDDFGTETMTMTADADGNTSFTMTVNDLTKYRFVGLKDGCRYTLTEDGEEGVKGSIRYQCGGGTDIKVNTC